MCPAVLLLRTEVAWDASLEGNVPSSLDFTTAKLGSGARFKKLSATLAARGATDPDALAAFIGRKKLGATGMAKLSGGASLANADDLAIYLSADDPDDDGDDDNLTCPKCNYSGSASAFGLNGASLDKSPSVLRTPQPSTASVRDGAAISVRPGKAAHSLAGTRSAVELASGTLTARRHPIQGPMDVLVARANDGTAVLRHRHGGATIARLTKTDSGKWVANVNGQDLAPRDHQRTALMEAVGTWNKAVTGSLKRADAPLQPPPAQTELMREYGIPAIRALATPATSSAGGPRVTLAAGAGSDDDSDDGTDDDGLTPKGQGIKKRLMAKGFPEARAITFAKMSQKTKPGAFGKQAVAS